MLPTSNDIKEEQIEDLKPYESSAIENSAATDLNLLIHYKALSFESHRSQDYDMVLDIESRLAHMGPEILPIIRKQIMFNYPDQKYPELKYEMENFYFNLLSYNATKKEIPYLLEAINICSNELTKQKNEDEYDAYRRPICQLIGALTDLSLQEREINNKDPTFNDTADYLITNILPIFNNADSNVYKAELLNFIATLDQEKYGHVIDENMANLEEWFASEIKSILKGEDPYINRSSFLNSIEFGELNRAQEEQFPDEVSEDYDFQPNPELEKRYSWWDSEKSTYPTYDEFKNAFSRRDLFLYAIDEFSRLEKVDYPEYAKVVDLVIENFGIIRNQVFSKDFLDSSTIYAINQTLINLLKEDDYDIWVEASETIEFILKAENGDKYLQRDLRRDLANAYSDSILIHNIEQEHRLSVICSNTFDNIFENRSTLNFLGNFRENIAILIAADNSGHLSNEKSEKLKEWMKEDKLRIIDYILQDDPNSGELLPFVIEYIQKNKIYNEADYSEYVKTLSKPSLKKISKLMDSEIKELVSFGELKSLDYLEEFGFSRDDAIKVMRFWKKGSAQKYTDETGEKIPYYRYSKIVEIHLEKISNLEKVRKGCSNTLYQEFGIANFGRYSTEQLITQYDQKDEDVPYILISNPVADWNGAFNTESLMSGLNESLLEFNRANNTRYINRIVEGNERKREFDRRLVLLDRRYGKRNKLNNVVIGGHSNGYKIFLSDEDEGFLDQESLKHPATPGVLRFFEEEPCFVFKACSTGIEGMYAQNLSRALNCYAYGPSEVAHLDSLKVALIYNKLRLVPIYLNDDRKDVTKLYYKGESISLPEN